MLIGILTPVPSYLKAGGNFWLKGLGLGIPLVSLSKTRMWVTMARLGDTRGDEMEKQLRYIPTTLGREPTP